MNADLPVDAWLTVPDLADRIGADVRTVRRLLQERSLVGMRDQTGVFRIPERFLVRSEQGWEVMAALQGTLTLLADMGFADDEAIRWLFTPDESLPGAARTAGPPAPVDSLAAGHKAEIRRRAQALGF